MWRIWRRLRRHNKARLAKVWVEYGDFRIRMIRYRPGIDWSVSVEAFVDDFYRARRSRGWKEHKYRHQWEGRVRREEKRARSALRKKQRRTKA